MQVELDSGKRVKVKAANVLLRFEKPAPAELMAASAETRRARSTWTWPGSSRPSGNSGFADLARRVLRCNAPAPTQQAAALLRLFAHRTTSAVSARASSRRRPKRP